MDKIEKMAVADAKRWAAAEMFYGPGAGTRRKLLNAEIEQRMVDLGTTDYTDLFNIAYENLDMNKFAQMAIKERKHLDRISKAHRNVRALKSGNFNNLSTGAFVVVGAVIVAKKTGYDKVIVAEAKKAQAWVVMKYRIQKASQSLKLKYGPQEGDDK